MLPGMLIASTRMCKPECAAAAEDACFDVTLTMLIQPLGLQAAQPSRTCSRSSASSWLRWAMSLLSKVRERLRLPSSPTASQPKVCPLSALGLFVCSALQLQLIAGLHTTLAALVQLLAQSIVDG